MKMSCNDVKHIDTEETMLTAPIDKLTGSAQAGDIAVSRGPNDVWRDCYRVKGYNKWEDVQPFTNPATWEFRQPMMVAAAYTGRTWEETNRTFLGQLRECNLACDFCYRGLPHDVVNVTPAEYVDAYLAYNAAYPDNRAGVMRISGGESLLYQEWVAETLWATGERGGDVNDENPFYVWIDTNLTVPMDDVLAMRCTDYGHPVAGVGVVGCFKPGICDLHEQIEIAAQIVDQGVDMYFSWSAGASDKLSPLNFMGFLAHLEEHIPNAPLRMYIQRINYSYGAVQEVNPDDWGEKNAYAQRLVESRRHDWREWCAVQYPVWKCNMPDHTIELG